MAERPPAPSSAHAGLRFGRPRFAWSRSGAAAVPASGPLLPRSGMAWLLPPVIDAAASGARVDHPAAPVTDRFHRRWR